MELDTSAVDAVLTTTRAVRRRLDLTRDVPDDVLLECIDIAEQAPTGGNQGSRRWLVIREPATKQRLAELYLEAAGRWMIETRDRLAGSGHPQEKVAASAAHLAEHLAQVPVLVIPTILGRHDGSGRPGLFDSVIQAVWSFCLALRARGLGSAWTTAGLSRGDEVAELLGIPEGVTQIALLPVAYTIGTDFRAAPRYPAREITYFDRYGRTIRGRRSEPATLADGHGVIVEADIAAPPEWVWELVSDINLPARFSTEFRGAEWTEGVEPGVGATFVGTNFHEALGEWQTTAHVMAYEPNRVFAWNINDPDHPGAQWRFELEGVAGATRLRYHLTLGPGPSGISIAIDSMPDKEPRILARRQDEHRRNMTATVEGIKQLAEGAEGEASEGSG
jgi:nitroreductase/uncharacterized protein YndB with AHSA1/START domain